MDAKERDGLKEKRLNLCLMEEEEDGERKRWRALEDKEEEEGKRVSEVKTAIYSHPRILIY